MSKDWRKMLNEIGGYENEFTAVAAGSVREMIDEIDRLRAELAQAQAALREAGVLTDEQVREALSTIHRDADHVLQCEVDAYRLGVARKED